MAQTPADMTPFQTLAREDSSLRWYVIADSAQHKALPAALVEGFGRAECLFSVAEDTPVARHAPHLVSVEPPFDIEGPWDWISLNAKKTPCVSVIATHAEFDVLHAHLSSCTEVVLPDGDEMFFAYWDPAILGALVGQADDKTLYVKGPILDAEQRSMLTAEVSHWFYWDRDGELHLVPMSRKAGPVKAKPFELTQQQVDDLVEASIPDHVLYYVKLNQPVLLSEIPEEKHYARVSLALGEAKSLGLSTMSDLVNYVCVDLVYGERMQSEPAIAAGFEKVRKREMRFDAALQTLP